VDRAGIGVGLPSRLRYCPRTRRRRLGAPLAATDGGAVAGHWLVCASVAPAGSVAGLARTGDPGGSLRRGIGSRRALRVVRQAMHMNVNSPRARWLVIFLWVSVFAWGVGL